MGRKGHQERVNKDHMLKVVDQTLAVKEVVCAEQEIPIKRHHIS